MKRFAGIFSVALSCAGCATYQPLPLATQAQARDNLATIRVDASSLALPILHPHVFDPSRGLDMTDIAMLAVAARPGAGCGAWLSDQRTLCEHLLQRGVV